MSENLGELSIRRFKEQRRAAEAECPPKSVRAAEMEIVRQYLNALKVPMARGKQDVKLNHAIKLVLSELARRSA